MTLWQYGKMRFFNSLVLYAASLHLEWATERLGAALPCPAVFALSHSEKHLLKYRARFGPTFHFQMSVSRQFLKSCRHRGKNLQRTEMLSCLGSSFYRGMVSVRIKPEKVLMYKAARLVVRNGGKQLVLNNASKSSHIDPLFPGPNRSTNTINLSQIW